MNTRIHSLVFIFSLLLWGCGSAPKAPRDARSENFAVTSQYLDLGGDVYAYMDVEGDVEKAAGLVNEVIDAVDEIPVKYKSRFDAVKIAKTLGLTDVHSIGMSSYANGDRFINKSFIKTIYPRTGVMQYLGGDPHPLEIVKLAPKDAVFAFENDVNLQAVLETLYVILEDVVDERTLSEIDEHLDSQIAPNTLTYREFVSHLNTKIMAAVWVHPTKKVLIPDTDVEMPYVDALLCVDNMGFLVDLLISEAKSIPMLSVWEDAEWQRLGVAEFLTEELLDYRPVVWRHKATDRVYVATSSRFLEERLLRQDALDVDEAFVALSASLPISQGGNSLVYISPQVLTSIKDSVDTALAKDADLKSVQKVVDVLYSRISPGQVWMSRNTPDGIYQISNSSFSHKFTLMGSLYINQLYGLSMLGGVISFIVEEAIDDVFSGLNGDSMIEEPPLPVPDERPDEYNNDSQGELEKELEKELNQQNPNSNSNESDEVPDYFDEFMKKWNSEQDKNKI